MIELAILVLAVHAAWLLLVIFGALWPRGRPQWSAAETTRAAQRSTEPLVECVLQVADHP